MFSVNRYHATGVEIVAILVAAKGSHHIVATNKEACKPQPKAKAHGFAERIIGNRHANSYQPGIETGHYGELAVVLAAEVGIFGHIGNERARCIELFIQVHIGADDHSGRQIHLGTLCACVYIKAFGAGVVPEVLVVLYVFRKVRSLYIAVARHVDERTGFVSNSADVGNSG